MSTWAVSSAAAHFPPVSVAWEAPPGCPTEARLQSEIEELLGRPLDSAENVPLSAHAEVTREGLGYRLHLAIRSAEGEKTRTLGDPSCETLGHAAAQILELAIEESNLARAATPPVDVDPVPPSEELPPAEPAGERPPPRVSSSRTTHVLAGLAAGVDSGSLPKPAPGVSVALVAERGRVWVGGTFGYWATERETLPGNAGGEFALATGGLRGCFALLRTRLRLGPCASFEAGTMVAHGFGVQQPGSGSVLWLAPSAAVEAAYGVASRVEVVTSLDATFPLAQREFFLENVGSVFRAPDVTARLVAGLRVEVW